MLFDASDFVTRDHCGAGFTPGLVWLWVLVSVALCAAYWTVAASRVLVWHRTAGTGYPRRWCLWIAAFFVGCGGGHLMNALAFVWPAYRLFVLWDALTLAASLVGIWGWRQLDLWQLRRHDELRRAVADAAGVSDLAGMTDLQVRELLLQRSAALITTARGTK